MEDSDTNENKVVKRPSLKKNSENKKQKKQVIWDDKELEEQETEKKLHPKTKILEPKTPYTGTVQKLIN